MTAKDCSQHDGKRKLRRRITLIAVALISTIIFLILLIWLILQPKKPTFILEDATIYAFNTTNSNFRLTSNIQVTILSRNPNNRIGIYYDRVDAYATYHYQQITLPTSLPPTYQGHHDVVVWSPLVYGTDVPLAPFLSGILAQDQMAGMVLVKIKIAARIRWKVGSWISGRYHIYATCPAYISFGSRDNGGLIVGSPVKYQMQKDCAVDVD